MLMKLDSLKLGIALIVSLVFVQTSSAFQSGAREVRALWVVRTTLTSPEKIRSMVNAAADNGFNTLIVQVRG